MADRVSLTTPVEELVERFPGAVGFLTRRGVRCIRCGEPLWCTLGELLEEEGVESPRLLVEELNRYIEKERGNTEGKEKA